MKNNQDKDVTEKSSNGQESVDCKKKLMARVFHLPILPRIAVVSKFPFVFEHHQKDLLPPLCGGSWLRL